MTDLDDVDHGSGCRCHRWVCVTCLSQSSPNHDALAVTPLFPITCVVCERRTPACDIKLVATSLAESLKSKTGAAV